MRSLNTFIKKYGLITGTIIIFAHIFLGTQVQIFLQKILGNGYAIYSLIELLFAYVLFGCMIYSFFYFVGNFKKEGFSIFKTLNLVAIVVMTMILLTIFVFTYLYFSSAIK